jgi:hypothetical protein
MILITILAIKNVYNQTSNRNDIMLCRVRVQCVIRDPHYITIRIRIHIRIRIKSWIRIRINLQMTSQNVWNMSLFEHFSQGVEPLFGSWDPDPPQGEKSEPDPYQIKSGSGSASKSDPQHCMMLCITNAPCSQ